MPHNHLTVLLTQHAIITLVNKITSTMNTGYLLIEVFLNMKEIWYTTKYYWTKCIHMASGVTY